MKGKIYSYEDKGYMEFDIRNSDLTVKFSIINDKIARLSFVCKFYCNIKNVSIEIPIPKNIDLIDLDNKKHKPIPFNNSFFIAFFGNYELQMDGDIILKISNKKIQYITGKFSETRDYSHNEFLKSICTI